MRLFRVLCCAAALTAFLAPRAHADQWNKLTYLTFSGPVQLPGTTLPAGTYMFKLADSMTNRHIVQVFDKDGTKLYATVLAIPDQRLEAAGKNIVLFGERPAGVPQAVRAWWYPGDTIGNEFVYPRSEAVQIAKANHQPVLATADEGLKDREHMTNAKVGHVDENGTMTNEENKPARSASAGTTATTTPPATTTAQQPAPAQHPSTTARNSARATTANRNAQSQPTGTSGQANAQPRRKTLPGTASQLPLIELLAGLSLAGAFGVRQLRKRYAER